MKERKWRRVIGTLVAAVLICVSLAGCSEEELGKDGSGDSQGNDKEYAGEQAK